MPLKEHGSLTKELPLARFDEVLLRIEPGMTLEDLRPFAAANRADAVPGLLAKRYLLMAPGNRIVFDRLLQELRDAGGFTPRLRKAMFFLWCWRDDRLRTFIIDHVADKHGHWRAAVLMDKARSKFFEQFHESGPAIKARSNLEEHLAKVGILDRGTKSINLDLSDGWLSLAVELAAEHEEDPTTAELLLRAPATVLSRDGLHKLAGATQDEAAKAFTESPPKQGILEDGGITEPVSNAQPKVKVWKERKIIPSSGGILLVTVDEVKRERASTSHHRLEKMLAQRAMQLGFEPRYDEHLDLFLSSGQKVLIAEIKSCTELNLHAQVRRGVAQLFEYRYQYALTRDTQAGDIDLLLVLELRPTNRKSWLIGYLQSVGITVAWTQAQEIVSISTLSEPFKDLLIPV